MDTTTSIAAPDGGMRPRLHAMWAAVAAQWGEHAGYVDERGAHLTELMLDQVSLRPGERVLELASGPGSVGIAAAERVGPEGEVVVSDVVAEMAAIAEGRARDRGLGNVTGRTLDIEQIDEPSASYDVVVCREGLMFATDPSAAVGEIHRVLRPGGRAAISVWGPRAHNPWLSVVFDAVRAQIGMPVPPPGIPGPFSLEDDGELRRLLVDAGFTGITISTVAVPVHAASFVEWWARTTALAGPLAQIVSSLPPAASAELRARARLATEPYRASGIAASEAIEIPGECLLATAHRP